MSIVYGGEPRSNGGGSPPSFVYRKMLIINPVNIKICIRKLISIYIYIFCNYFTTILQSSKNFVI